MAAKAQCDSCGEEPGTYWLTNQDTGATSTLGPSCFALIGMGMFLSNDTSVVDTVLETRGYAPDAAEKKRRKDAQVPDVDVDRTIVTITETEPRPPINESTDPLIDESASGFVDNELTPAESVDIETSEMLAESATPDGLPSSGGDGGSDAPY